MTLVDGTGGSNPKAIVVGLVVVCVLLVGVYLAFSTVISLLSPSASAGGQDPESLKGTFWACSAMTCSRLMSGQEWVNKYCATIDTVTLCRVKGADGRMTAVPIGQIDTRTISECAEYLCMQESLVRNASYRIAAP